MEGAPVGPCDEKFRATLPPVWRLTHAASKVLKNFSDRRQAGPSRARASPTTLIVFLTCGVPITFRPKWSVAYGVDFRTFMVDGTANGMAGLFLEIAVRLISG